MTHIDLMYWLESAWTLERRLSLLLVDHGLTLARFRVMRLLAANDKPTPTRLSADLGVTKATVAVLLKELSDSGLVQIVPNPNDRRSQLLSLTAAGSKRLNEATDGVRLIEKQLGRKAPRQVVELANRLARLSMDKDSD